MFQRPSLPRRGAGITGASRASPRVLGWQRREGLAEDLPFALFRGPGIDAVILRVTLLLAKRRDAAEADGAACLAPRLEGRLRDILGRGVRNHGQSGVERRAVQHIARRNFK